MPATTPTPDPAATRDRELKVKIPLGFHVRLHSIKVITGKPISDVVTEALDAYFSHEEDAQTLVFQS